MKGHRLQLKSGANSRPSRQGAGVFARIVLLTISVAVVWICALRSATSMQKQSALLEFVYDGHEDEEDSEDEAEEMLIRNTEIRQTQMSGTPQNSTVIHVIHTRFMQYQPNLTDLGLARVLLFEIFSLPTMLRQSSQNFLWIFRTDPDLNSAVREKFLALVEPYPNIYVIGANGSPEGFRSSEYMADIQPETVWSGDYQLLLDSHQKAQTSIVVESRLDADDGLYTDFVADIQNEAIKFLSNDETSWKLWCSDVYMDWQLISPWNGFDPESGVLMMVQSPICVTPGLSIGYGVKAIRSDVPGKAHNILHKVMPACDDANIFVKCLSWFPTSKFSAVRARTITSAGMQAVVLKSSKKKMAEKTRKTRQRVQEKMWGLLKDLFGISKESVTSTRRSLMEQQSTLASENLKGQCTKDSFTCKGTTRARLQKVLDGEGEAKSNSRNSKKEK